MSTKVATINRFWLALCAFNLIALGRQITLGEPFWIVLSLALSVWTAYESGIVS